MEKTLIVGGSVSGNVGSCEVKSTDIKISSWSYRTIAVNSCTGQVVSESTYRDYGNIFVGVMGILFVIGIVLFMIVGAIASSVHDADIFKL